MLEKQRLFLEYINKSKELLENSNIFINEIVSTEEIIKNAELIVPVIGGFSAGKSTLINSFLGSNILPTNLTPETALATELRYSKENYTEAVRIDDSIDRYEISQNEIIKENASNYQYLRLHLNNEKLKEIEPLVLVDMPGFDSPLELHNKAILNYLQRGVYFIVLTSIEDGGLTKSILREIENITEFGKGFSFCLSKTNLKPLEEVKDVQNRIKEQLSDELDFEKEIVLLDDNGGKNLEKILKDIDTENLFYILFIDRLKDNYFHIDSQISTKIATLESSKQEAQKVIQSLKDGIKKILSKKEQLITEIKERYSINSSESIVDAVASELIKNQDLLISLALQNQNLFQKEINDIIKNRLIYELNKKLDNISADIIDDFTYELKDIGNDNENFALDEQWVESISEGIQILLNSTQTGLEKLTTYTKGKEGSLYKVITTSLGIVTTVLNPILEIVIIFLPDIINFFASKTQEEKQKELLKSKFHSEIVPSLKIKLRDVVQSTMQEQIENLINSISDKFEAELKQKELEIEETLQEKEQNIIQTEVEIEKLKKIQLELQTLTSEKLLQRG